MKTIIEKYNDVIKVIMNLNRIDRKRLTKDVYLYSINIYKNKIFTQIKKSNTSIFLENETFIYETLINITILTLNYLQNIDSTNTDSSIINKNKQLFEKKNNDYGNSFEDFELIGILVRLNDKINRIIQLLNDSHCSQINESLIDTLNDLYNYGIIGLTYKN